MKKSNIFFAAIMALLIVIYCTSCNVTRVITNQSEYTQKGDTTVLIQTKTTETYNAKKQIYGN